MNALLKKLEAEEGGLARSSDPGRYTAAHDDTTVSVQIKEMHAVPRHGWLDGPGRFRAHG